jgi:zinc transport system permease protein
LVSSLIIFPAVTALQVARGFRSALVLSTVAGVASVILGIFAAYLFDAPAGASIVMVNFVFFALAYTGGRLFRL